VSLPGGVVAWPAPAGQPLAAGLRPASAPRPCQADNVEVPA